MLSIRPFVHGKMVQREPPNRKAWETVREPRLLVIGRHRMKVGTGARGDRSHVTIAIDYELPAKAPTPWMVCNPGFAAKFDLSPQRYVASEPQRKGGSSSM